MRLPRPDPLKALAGGVLGMRRGLPVLAGGAVLVGVFWPGVRHAPTRALRPLAAAPVIAATPATAEAAPPDLGIPALGPLLPLGPVVALPGDTGFTSPNLAGTLAGPSCDQPVGFASPYLGHTNNFDGAGGQTSGATKAPDMDLEVAMGLHWTFTPVYWAKFEPNGPTSAANDPAGAWKELDGFMDEAHKRGLNPLFQLTVGGNAGGPPSWAGQRTSGKSAPVNMKALADFAGKLAQRYRPDGALAEARGWGSCFGTRAWEMDNEVNSYETDWTGEAGDYAEFVTLAYRQIHAADPGAVVLPPSISLGGATRSNGAKTSFLDDVLAVGHNGDYTAQYATDPGGPFVAGPWTDAVSFHDYEQLDCLFGRLDCTVTTAHQQVRDVMEDPLYTRQKGFEYGTGKQYWCTECEYDFGVTDPGVGYRADWVVQWMTRAFADGIDKLTIMDANNSTQEQTAVTTWIKVFRDHPYGIRDVTTTLGLDPTQVTVYRWASPVDGHWIYVAWAANKGAQSYTIQVPVRTATNFIIDITGQEALAHPAGGKVSLTLAQGAPFSAPTFLVDGLPGAP